MFQLERSHGNEPKNWLRPRFDLGCQTSLVRQARAGKLAGNLSTRYWFHWFSAIQFRFTAAVPRFEPADAAK
jgi:hypothetical protein